MYISINKYIQALFTVFRTTKEALSLFRVRIIEKRY